MKTKKLWLGLVAMGIVVVIFAVYSNRDDDGRKPSHSTENLTDGQIAEIIIEESIQAYPGPCACPYQLASNGSRCGR